MNYGNVEEFMAANFPYVPLPWLKKVNQRLGQYGNCLITSLFKDNQEQYTDCTERTFGEHAPLSRNHDIRKA
jgi:hypothetical protein